MTTPSTPPPTDPRALGRRRLAARRLRTHRIRVGVAAATVSTFIALFSGLYVQMASGHDPALGSTGSSASSSAVAQTQTQSQTSSGTVQPLTTGQS